ncbi:MAG: glyoxalase, partial [Cytophagales bacterium]|nr:glyoxalase [Cytophagales bacterium]
MKIEHLAIWAEDIEKLRRFYEKYFHATSNDKYMNPMKKFSSYFLSFDSDTRLEIMHMDSVKKSAPPPGESHLGFAHLAFSVGSQERVEQLTAELQQDGYTVLDGPR